MTNRIKPTMSYYFVKLPEPSKPNKYLEVGKIYYTWTTTIKLVQKGKTLVVSYYLLEMLEKTGILHYTTHTESPRSLDHKSNIRDC